MPENIQENVVVAPEAPKATTFVAEKVRVQTKKVSVVKQKKKTRLKTNGEAGAKAISNVAAGKKNDSGKLAIYHKGDSVEKMEQATADLIAGSSRRLFELAEEKENDRIKHYLSKRYVPKSERGHQVSEEDLLRARLNMI